MNSIADFLRRFSEIFIWWTVIQPWERALRVRLGNRVLELAPGVHLKVPYIDSVYRQSIRLRYCMLGVQTITTTDGKTITLMATIGYKIHSIEQLYNTLHHAEETIRQLAMSEIAQFVQQHTLSECDPTNLEKTVSASIDLTKFGITSDSIRITDFAVVRTYRLISDMRYATGSDTLDTNRRDITAASNVPY